MGRCIKIYAERGQWMWGSLKRCLGNVRDTSFWESQWVGSASLQNQFSRLFHLCSLREARVSEGSGIIG